MNAIKTLSRVSFVMGMAGALAILPAGRAQTSAAKPVKVTIQEDKTEFGESVLPLDPAVRVEYQYTGNMTYGVTGEGKNLTCGPGAASTAFKIDGQIFFGEGNAVTQQLPPGVNGKKRTGLQVISTRGDLKITMILEVVPGKPYGKNAAAGQKRRMDTLLIKHVIENTGTKPHEVAARAFIDTMCGNNDGAIFASPTTHPGKYLDGVMLKDKEVPDFIEMLEVANLQNPGFTGVFTFKMGNKVEAPNKIVLTGQGAGVMGDAWEVAVAPARGDSAVAFFWDTKEIKPKGKREIAFALGQSVACNPDSEGKVSINFGGSFEPNKEFTVTAYVDEPIDGQSLTLELPKGMERVQGKQTQAVPLSNDGRQSIVMWKGRVQDLGTFPVRIRSSTGVTYTRTVAISRP